MFHEFAGFNCQSSIGVLDGYCLHHPKESLLDKEKGDIFDFLYPVALSAFSQRDTSFMRDDVYKHLFAGDGLIVVMDGNTAVAFRMWNIFIRESASSVLYLSGMCVHKRYQGMGVGLSLINYMLGKLIDCSYVALRTQSPVMKRCFDQSIGTLSFPNGVCDAPESVKDVGSFVAVCLGDGTYDRESFISEGVYGSSLYGTVPCSSDELYQKQFGVLNQSRGDAMMCVWQRNSSQ